jgi:putative membrane fusion protein
MVNKTQKSKLNKKNAPKAANKKRKKTRNKTADTIAIILLIGVAVLIFFSAKNSISLSMIDFANVEEGQITDGIDGKALILREETLITASAAGKFTPTLAEGARVKSGTTVGYIEQESGNKISITATKTGIVSYNLDGAEGLAQQDDLNELNIAQLFALLDPDMQSKNQTTGAAASENDTLGKNTAVCKIIDNLLDYTIIIAVPQSSTVADSDYLKFSVPDWPQEDTATATSNVFNAKVNNILQDGSYKYIVMNFLPKVDFFSQNRYFAAKLVQNIYAGQIIPASAIIEKNGQSGVYKSYKKRFVFAGIEIKGIIDDQAAVSGLTDGDKVVINPQKLSAKQKGESESQ